MFFNYMFYNPFAGLISVAAIVWVIYDVWTKLKANDQEKILWSIAAVIGTVLTAIIYYFVKIHNKRKLF